MTTTIPVDDSPTHVIAQPADDEPPARRGALILFGASCAIAVAAGLGAVFFGAPDPAPVVGPGGVESAISKTDHVVPSTPGKVGPAPTAAPQATAPTRTEAPQWTTPAAQPPASQPPAPAPQPPAPQPPAPADPVDPVEPQPDPEPQPQPDPEPEPEPLPDGPDDKVSPPPAQPDPPKPVVVGPSDLTIQP